MKALLLNPAGYHGFWDIKFPVTVEALRTEFGLLYVTDSEIKRVGGSEWLTIDNDEWVFTEESYELIGEEDG